MLYKNVNIDAFGYALPPERITSSELEERLTPAYERLGLPKGRLELMTGIRERRFWASGTKPSDAAVLAGEDALSKANIDRESVDCAIMCSVCRDFLEPATATVVHHALGLSPRAMVFDLSNACLGLLTGMSVAANLIENGAVGTALLVSGEDSRPLVENTIRRINEDLTLTRQSVKPLFASLTIGSGAAAVVLSRRSPGKPGLRFVGGPWLADTQHNGLCQGGDDRAETLMRTDAETLLRQGVETADKTWKAFLDETRWRVEDIDVFCGHQVGKAHRDALFGRLGLPLEKDFQTYDFLGNIGSASCPITAAMAIESGRLPPGGKLATLGIGSGIVCSMLGVERDPS